MGEARDTISYANFFTNGSHHRKVTILYLVQNMFDQGKSLPTVSLNNHYIVLFCNLSEQSQFTTMAAKILPKNSQWHMDAYSDTTAKSYRYLFIDNSPHCNPIFRFRPNIFIGDLPRVYCDRKAVYKWPRSPLPNYKFNRWTDKQIKIVKGP